MALFKSRDQMRPYPARFKICDRVWFYDAANGIIKKGEIVKLISELNKNAKVIETEYTVSVEGEDSPHVFDENTLSESLEECCRTNGVKEYNMEVFVSHCAALCVDVYAKSVEEAQEILRKRHPEAESISESDPWR